MKATTGRVGSGPIRLVLIAVLLSACLPGCVIGDSGDWEVYCSPTGNALGGSGVYIGPEGCDEVTLYALDDSPDNATWVLMVSWPMHGDHPVLELHNLTTNARKSKVIYLFDPSFTLFTGESYSSGFRMVEGDNDIEYLIYTDEEDGRNIIEEGQFTLKVIHTDTPAT